MSVLSKTLRFAALLAVLAAAPAMAQDPGVTGELERVASTTPQEKLDYAVAAKDEMRAAVKDISTLADTARRENEQERLQCINARLTTIRALLQVTEAAESAMQVALEAGESERADHEFRKIAVARTKTRELVREAQACVTGKEAIAEGETIVTVEGGEFPDESDLLDTPFDPFDLGNDAPEQSPYL